jgi:hypothetical protein
VIEIWFWFRCHQGRDGCGFDLACRPGLYHVVELKEFCAGILGFNMMVVDLCEQKVCPISRDNNNRSTYYLIRLQEYEAFSAVFHECQKQESTFLSMVFTR